MKCFIKNTLLSIVSFALIFNSPLCSAAKEITIAAYEFQPYSGSNLKNGGFTVEIVSTAFARKGYKTVVSMLPWKRALKSIENETVDVLINLYYTKARAQKYGIPSEYITYSTYVFFTLKSNLKAHDNMSIETLKQYKIGLIEPGSHGEKFDKIKQSLNIIKRISETTLLKMLVNRRGIDLVPADIHAGTHILQSRTDKFDQVKIIHSNFFKKQKLYPVFSKSNPKYQQFMSDYDSSITEMKADGTLKAIYEKHGMAYTP